MWVKSEKRLREKSPLFSGQAGATRKKDGIPHTACQCAAQLIEMLDWQDFLRCRHKVPSELLELVQGLSDCTEAKPKPSRRDAMSGYDL